MPQKAMKTPGKQIFLIGLTVAFLLPVEGFPQQAKPALEERIIRLEEGQERLKQSIDDLRQTTFALFGQVDKRFEQMDKRFEQMDKRFDDMNSWLRNIVALVITAFGGMLGLWLLMWKKMNELSTLLKVELTNGSLVEAIQRQKTQGEEFEKLKKRIEELEAKVAQKRIYSRRSAAK